MILILVGSGHTYLHFRNGNESLDKEVTLQQEHSHAREMIIALSRSRLNRIFEFRRRHELKLPQFKHRHCLRHEVPSLQYR